MSGKFLVLTEKQDGSSDRAIIVNIGNIGQVYSDNGGTTIQMNYRRKDGYPVTIHVAEGFEFVKEALGI